MESCPIAPLHDRVVVKPDAAETAIGNILLPDSSQARPRKGVVVAVGPGRTTTETGVLVPPTVKAGDYVIFSNWGEFEYRPLDGGDSLFILKESDLYCVIVNNEKI